MRLGGYQKIHLRNISLLILSISSKQNRRYSIYVFPVRNSIIPLTLVLRSNHLGLTDFGGGIMKGEIYIYTPIRHQTDCK